MEEWRLECEQVQQLSQRHAVLHHNKWSSSYIPARGVSGMANGERMDRSKLSKLQAKLMHAVADRGEREAGGREQAHGWKLTADRSQQRARLNKKGFQFARVGGSPWMVYGQGSSSYQPYQPCPDDPRLGAPIGGWKEHTDWTPDRNAPATAFHKHLPPGHSQPWFQNEPKSQQKKPKKSVYGNDASVGGWQLGTSLAPRRAADYVSNQALGAEISRDLKRTEARLRLTRAGILYADVLEERNLPYRPSRSARPSTAPPRRTATSDEHSGPKLETTKRGSTTTRQRRLGTRPSTADTRRPGSVAFAATTRVESTDAAEVVALAATDAVEHGVLAVNSTVTGAEKQETQEHDGDSRTLWVGNLEKPHSDQEIIKAVFEVIGGHQEHDDVVEDVVIHEKPAPQKNWCLVTFFEVQHTQLALLSRERLLKEEGIELPDISKDWKTKLYEAEMIHSNAAKLLHKVSENVVHHHDVETRHIVQKHVRQHKVMMGPRYERPMVKPRQHRLKENERRELLAAERFGVDPNSNAGHLVKTIAAFGAVEDQKNKEMKHTLEEHTQLQTMLYTNALKAQWGSTRGTARPLASPPSEGQEGPNPPKASPKGSSRSLGT